MRFMHNWLRFVWAICRLRPVPALLTTGFTLVAGLQLAAEFWALKRLVDYLVQNVSTGLDWRQVALWLGVLAGASLVGEVSRGLQPFLYEWLRQDAELVLDARLLEKAGRAPLIHLETSDFFNQFQRARDGLRRNIFMVIEGTQRLAVHLISVITVLGALATAHWAAPLALLAAGIPVWIIRRKVADDYLKIWFEQTEPQRRARYFYDVLTRRQAAQEIRLFTLAGELLTRWRDSAWTTMRERVRLTDRTARLDAVAGVTVAIGFAAAVTILGLAAVAGSLTIGAFAAAVKVTQDMQGHLVEAIWQFGGLRRSAGFAFDFWVFFDTPDQPESGDPATASSAGGPPVAVNCSGLSFTYPGSERPAVSDVTCQVAPGELIALVGENGAGKSTLVKLLMGLYPATAGTLTLDGVDPYSPEGAAVRRRIAPVFQDFARYSVAAGENIGVGDAACVTDQARVEAAAAGSGASDVVAGLSKGYDTILGREWEGGAELSGGQWQKIAIARGYMRDAGLLVLDEPTAALDPLAELEVFRRFKQLVKGRTGFLISHRLGAARLADRVFVLKEGQLVETGTHDELMALGGEYAALFKAQAGWYH